MSPARFFLALLATGVAEAADVTLAPGSTDAVFGPEANADQFDTSTTTTSAKSAPDQPADELVVVPNPSYNPVFGGMLTVLGLYAYRPTPTTRSPWLIGAGAFATQNGSWGIGAFQEARPGDDTWRIQAAVGYADLRYRYYGSGPSSPLLNNPVELRQRMSLVGGNVLRKAAEHLYIGPVASWRNITIDPELPIPGAPELHARIVSPGITAVYDSREQSFAPRSGSFGKVRLLKDFANDTQLGNVVLEDKSYERAQADANHYIALAEKTVLAVRVATQWCAKDTPFFDQPFLGKGADLRGYAGEYRDLVLTATQSEIRQDLAWHFGVIGFAGVGTVVPTYAALRDADWHPSLGGSVVYQVAPANHINLRFDTAWGDEGWTYYLSVGDAF